MHSVHSLPLLFSLSLFVCPSVWLLGTGGAPNEFRARVGREQLNCSCHLASPKRSIIIWPSSWPLGQCAMDCPPWTVCGARAAHSARPKASRTDTGRAGELAELDELGSFGRAIGRLIGGADCQREARRAPQASAPQEPSGRRRAADSLRAALCQCGPATVYGARCSFQCAVCIEQIAVCILQLLACTARGPNKTCHIKRETNCSDTIFNRQSFSALLWPARSWLFAKERSLVAKEHSDAQFSSIESSGSLL